MMVKLSLSHRSSNIKGYTANLTENTTIHYSKAKDGEVLEVALNIRLMRLSTLPYQRILSSTTQEQML